MRRPPRRRESDAQITAGRCREPAIGRLTVDQKPARIRDRVRGRGPIAAALLSDNEQQANPPLAGGPQPLGSGHLRCQNAFRVTRATANEAAVLDAAREKRRHAIEVRREDHVRLVESGEDVGASSLDTLLDDVVAKRTKTCRQPFRRFPFTASRRVDVDERSREREDV